MGTSLADAVEAPDTDPPEAEAPDATEAPADPSGLDKGWYLTADGKAVKKQVQKDWKAQAAYQQWRRQIEAMCERMRMGERGLSVERVAQDESYRIRRGWEAESIGKGPNLADQLLRRMSAILTTDPPLPEVTANSREARELEAAELAQRILRVEGSDAERNDAAFLASAIDQAGTYGSMYSYWCVDPQGGGLQPVEVEAHKDAVSADDPLTMVDPTFVPPVDDLGAPIPVEPPRVPANPAQVITRYVRVDGTLTDVEAEAQLAWQPKVVRHLLPPACVTLLPAGVEAKAAHGVIVGRLMPLREVISRFYDGERPDAKVCKKLAEWKPDGIDYELWVSPVQRQTLPETPPKRELQPGEAEAQITDDALCAVLVEYLLTQPDAPFGAYVAIGGPDEPLKRGEWRALIGEGETAHYEAWPLPVVQLKAQDAATGDPNGQPPILNLAAESNLDDTLTEYILDYVWRASNPHVWLNFGSVVQPEAFKARTRTPLIIDGEGVPTYEEIPALDSKVYDVWEKNREGMQASSGIPATVANGAQDGSVTSGVQQRLVREETLVGLQTLKQNADSFMVGGWGVHLTLLKSIATTPQLLRYTGESGDVQVKSWVGQDLDGINRPQIAKGSGTMLSPTAKVETAREELEVALKVGDMNAIEQWHEQILTNQGSLVGLQDDPHRARVQRQIQQVTELLKRPDLPDAIEEPPPMLDPMGQPVPQPPQDPIRQELAEIWKPNPTDARQVVAKMRLSALSKFAASRLVEQADPRVQESVWMAFEAARQAAGEPTVAEQQQAAQAQAVQAQNSEIAKIDAKKSQDPLPGVPGKAQPGPEAPAPQGPPPEGIAA